MQDPNCDRLAGRICRFTGRECALLTGRADLCPHGDGFDALLDRIGDLVSVLERRTASGRVLDARTLAALRRDTDRIVGLA